MTKCYRIEVGPLEIILESPNRAIYMCGDQIIPFSGELPSAHGDVTSSRSQVSRKHLD